MSNSNRKLVGLFNKKLSEKRDKQLSSRKLRRKIKALLSSKDAEIIYQTVFPIQKEVADVYNFAKDDMRFF